MTTKPKNLWWLSVAAVLAATACTDSTSPTADEATVDSPAAEVSSSTETSSSSPLDDAGSNDDRELVALPTREGPRRETTYSVPHVQVDAVLVPELDAELHRRVYSLPGVEERESELSLGGARSLWLADDVELVRPEILLSGREFAHIHPNGSLHVWLPVDRAIEVATTKWGELSNLDPADFG